MPSHDWLPEQYRAPILGNIPKAESPTNTITQKEIVNTPKASLLSGLGGSQFFIESETLQTILKETKLCQQYFQAAKTHGYRTYSIQSCIENNKFLGIKVTLDK